MSQISSADILSQEVSLMPNMTADGMMGYAPVSDQPISATPCVTKSVHTHSKLEAAIKRTGPPGHNRLPARYRPHIDNRTAPPADLKEECNKPSPFQPPEQQAHYAPASTAGAELLGSPKNVSHGSLPKSIRFRIGCPEIITYLQFVKGGVVINEVPFLYSIISKIQKITFSPGLDFEDGYLVKLDTIKGRQSIFISESKWDSRKVLEDFQNVGIQISPLISISLTRELFKYLLSCYMGNVVTLTVDPRPGIVPIDEKYLYLFGENNFLPVPSIPVANAALKKAECSPSKDIEKYFYLLSRNSRTLPHLFKLLFVWGTYFSIIRRNTLTPQTKFIFLHCKSEYDVAQICAHFLVWNDQEKKIVTISSPHKSVEEFLNYAKDRCLLINTNVPDVSKRRMKNIALLEQYVTGGVAPNDFPAEALIILVGIDIPPGIPLEDLLIFEIEEHAIAGEVKEHPLYASAFVNALIAGFNENASLCNHFNKLAGVTDTQKLMARLSHISTDMIFQYFGIEGFKSPSFQKDEQSFINCLMQKSYPGDDSGNLMLLIDEIEKQWKSKSLVLKKNTDLFPTGRLSETLIFDKQSIFMADQLLERLLPKMYQMPPTLIVFRKILDGEQVLDKSAANQNGLKKRIRLKNGERPYGTAIHLDAALEYSSEEFKTVIKEEFL